MRILTAVVIFSVLSATIGFMPDRRFFAHAEEDGFRQLRSSHFIINYREGVNSLYVSKIKNISEKYYRVITQQFNFFRDKFWTWENRAKVFIARDRDDYLDIFGCSPWSAACVDYYNKIIYTYPNQEKFTPIFVHELTHIIFREFVGEGVLPLWLDEGVAVYMEDKYGGTYRQGINFLKHEMARGNYIKFSELNQITVDRLNDKQQDYINLFYLESFSIVNFIMNKYGKYKFSNFLRRIKSGLEWEDALTKVFYDFKDLNKFEEEWKKYYRN